VAAVKNDVVADAAPAPAAFVAVMVKTYVLAFVRPVISLVVAPIFASVGSAVMEIGEHATPLHILIS
jgi:hypothetical protein